MFKVFTHCSAVSIFDFEQVNAGWGISETWRTEVFKNDLLGHNTSSINLNWCLSLFRLILLKVNFFMIASHTPWKQNVN